jgi:hypothetical protein
MGLEHVSIEGFQKCGRCIKLRRAKDFQQEIDMMQVEAPSSTTVWKMFLPIVHTLIWKAT